MKTFTSLLFAVCAVALFSVSCADNTETLSLSAHSLAFEASVNQPQPVTVDSKKNDWAFEVAPTSSSWIEAKREGNVLNVSVKDNTKAEKRTGSIKITSDDPSVDAQEITVNQKGSTPEVMISAASLDFDGEKAAAQEVTVTMSGDTFTWVPIVEGTLNTWVKVEAKEDKFIVNVEDNPTVKERSAKIIVTPSKKGVLPKTVFVTQKGKVLPPAISVDKPEGLTFESRDANMKAIKINPVSCKWTASAKDENGVGVKWVKIDKIDTKTEQSVYITVDPNISDERSAYVVITAVSVSDGEPIAGVPVIKVKVTQAKGRPAVSTLEDDVKYDATTYRAVVFGRNPSSKATVSQWYIDFMDGTVVFEDNGSQFPSKPSVFRGTGNRLYLSLISPVVIINDDQEYYIPNENDYNVRIMSHDDELNPQPYLVVSGRESYASETSTFAIAPSGSWYYTIVNDVEVEAAPIVRGTMHVERTGFNYNITMELYDDADHRIDVTYNGKLNKVYQPNAKD